MTFSTPPKYVRNAIERLSRLHYLSNFANFEDWVSTEYFDCNDARVETELAYFNVLYRFIALEYRKQGYYPSSGALSDVLFAASLAHDPQGFLSRVEKMMAASTALSASILIFPLQGIGFTSGKNLFFLNPASRFYYDGPGFRIIPQTNSYERTIAAIQDFIAKSKLKRKAQLDYSTFDHYRRTRHLKWFENNPLLLCSFNFTQDLPLDNFWVLYERVTSIASKVYLAKALSSTSAVAVADLGLSTANVNNFETRDIKHFLTVTSAAKTPHVLCQHMAMARYNMVDDTEFSITH